MKTKPKASAPAIFAHDHLIHDGESFVDEDTLYAEYVQWCQEIGLDPNSKNEFQRILTQIGYGTSTRIRRGIRIQKN